MHIACQHVHRRIRRCGEDRKPHRGLAGTRPESCPATSVKLVVGQLAAGAQSVRVSSRSKSARNTLTQCNPRTPFSPVSHAHPPRTQTIHLHTQSAEEAGSKCTFAGRRWGRHTPHKNRVKPARQLRKGRPAAGRAANGPVTNSWCVTGRWCQT